MKVGTLVDEGLKRSIVIAVTFDQLKRSGTRARWWGGGSQVSEWGKKSTNLGANRRFMLDG